MLRFSKFLFFAALFAAALLACSSAIKNSTPAVSRQHRDSVLKSSSLGRVHRLCDSLLPYLKKNGYSTQFMLIADMQVHMHLNRFYMVHPLTKKIYHSSLVAHGQGGGSKWDSVVFSNVPGSLCSSEGKYKIGSSYVGNYGKGYKLLGLDKTNSNALKRLIVLHAYETQTDKEYGKPNYLSSGCPMLSPRSFHICDSLIALQKKPVLLFVAR